MEYREGRKGATAIEARIAIRGTRDKNGGYGERNNIAHVEANGPPSNHHILKEIYNVNIMEHLSGGSEAGELREFGDREVISAYVGIYAARQSRRRAHHFYQIKHCETGE